MEDLKTSETWRVFRIQSELVEGFETMHDLGPAVSIFGSSRLQQGNRYYDDAVAVAKILADDGFAIITGGRPGIMEDANRGAKKGKAPSVGLNIEIPTEQLPNKYQDISLSFRYFFIRKLMLLSMPSPLSSFPAVSEQWMNYLRRSPLPRQKGSSHFRSSCTGRNIGRVLLIG